MKSRTILILFLLLGGLEAHAKRYDIYATVGWIRYHEATNTLASSWGKTLWFGLKNPIGSPSPNCGTYNDYNISVPQDNDVAISMILAAKMSGKQVLVTIDDTIKYPSNSATCKLQYITITND